MNDKQFEEAMGEIRKDIDRVDSELLPLLIERMKCSSRVAEIKKAAGKPVLDVSREKAILDRIRKSSTEYGDSLVPIYRTIMAVSRSRQHDEIKTTGNLKALIDSAYKVLPRDNVKVICQGVSGAYSHRAARKFFPDSVISFTETWQDIFRKIDSGEADFGVVPVENSNAGAVNDVYTLIMEYRFYIAGAEAESINHCIAAVKEHRRIEKVISHKQGLMQCSEYIKENGLETDTFSNTAAAAKYVSESGNLSLAAICSKEAAEEYGLEIIKENIQNARQNATRFIVLSKKPVFPKDANKISLCFALPHESGSLYSTLERFAAHGLNLTKIESRPISSRNFEYDFYLDFTGNIRNEDTAKLIAAMEEELPRFSFLGNYKDMG